MYVHMLCVLTVGCKMATSELVMLPRNEGSGMSSSAGEHWHSAGFISTHGSTVLCPGDVESLTQCA